MGGFESFYTGTGYGGGDGYSTFESGYGKLTFDQGFQGHGTAFGNFSFPSDPTTANQLKAVSDKLNTGTKNIEVSGVNIAFGEGSMRLLDSIPKQQFKEINRLKKLVGADLTFHGPLVELSGIQGGKYEEVDRQLAEKEAWRTLELAHVLGPKTTVVFHSSNLPLGQYEKRVKVRRFNEKTGKEEIVEELMGGLMVDEDEGTLARVPEGGMDYLTGVEVKDIDARIRDVNKKTWDGKVQRVNFAAEQAMNGFENAKKIFISEKMDEKNQQTAMQYLKKYIEAPDEAQEYLDKLGPYAPTVEKMTREFMYGEIYIRDSYNSFKEVFNEAYEASKRNPKDREVLEEFRREVAPKIKEIEGDPARIEELGNILMRGVSTLRRIGPPQKMKKINDFMIEKSAETLANVAVHSYSQYKDDAPIIAIENPPADRFALSRADELLGMVNAARKQFTEKAMKSQRDGGLGMSEKEARKKAEELIGLTWDTAHINLIRGHGYTRQDVIKETEKVAKQVKHIHVSDNFGLANTELPAGMGNSPIPDQLKLIAKYNEQLKKTVETGSWYSAMKMRHTPIIETVGALGSPIYSMKMAPHWGEAAHTFGGYFSGVGATNPDIHHQLYGAGFANIPIDLGGQMQGRSRASGTPFE